MTDEALGARVSEAIRSGARPPSRGEALRRSAMILILAGAAAVAIFVAWGGVSHGVDIPAEKYPVGASPRSPALIALTVAGTVAIAVAALTVTYGRGRSALPRPLPVKLAAIFVTPAALFVWKVGVSAMFEGECVWWPDRVGLRCLGVSMTVGSALLAALLYTRRGTDPVEPVSTGAGFGVATGALAAVLVDLWCPVGHPAHVLLGHVLPLILFGVLGGAVGGRVLDLRP